MGFEIETIIDHREHAFIEAFDGIKTVKALDMGDIVVVLKNTTSQAQAQAQAQAQSTELCVSVAELNETETTTGISPQQSWVFERKTLADLASSIKDGRYREQKARLLAHFAPHRITYILEEAPSVNKWCGGGDGGNKSTNLLASNRTTLTVSTFQGFVFNTLYRDGIHVLFTRDVDDTVAVVRAFVEKLEKSPEVFMATGATGVAACSQDTAMMVKSRPGANVTPDLCWRLMLSQIPGVSQKLSQEIVKLWPSMSAFVHDLEPLGEKERVTKLKSVPLLGPKKATIICAYVFR